jgi:intracellular multiplication protein IcmE
MAKLSNVTNALKDTKTRTIFIVIIIIIILAIAIGWLGLSRTREQGLPAGASVAGAPGIESIPGLGTPTREYTKTQEQENALRAQQAAQGNTTSIPTITRTTYIGPSAFNQPGVPGSAGNAATTADCSPDALARARQAGVKAEELRCKGCDAAALRAAGYTAGELMNAGFSAQQLKDAGFTAAELREAGFTAAELARAGFSPADLAAAGYSAAELAQAGISADQLAAAGITAQQLAAAGIGAAGATGNGKLPKDCSVEKLKAARNQGVSAAALRKMGCGVAALRAAGYSAKELKDAGFNAKELKDGGFSAQDLKAAGFSAGELRQAGFSANDLKNAGFSAADLRDAGFSAEELANAGFTADELKAAGFTDGELMRAGIVAAPTAGATTTGTSAAQEAAGPTTAAGFGAVPSVNASDAGVEALERLQKRQAEQLSLQERQERITAIQQAMSQQAGDLFASWSPPATQDFVQGEKEQNANEMGAAGQQGGAGAAGQAAEQPPIVKAGTIMFAVLDTALNSDEPSPILATIVEGPYKGAKLVGNFQRVNKKVLVSFNLINIPSYASSIPINAVAIDPNTARTALADDVNSHYLLRYGTLFGSAFIDGLARATEESGSTTVVSFGQFSNSTPILDTGEKLTIAGGEVGKRFAQAMGSIFHTPPTVKVNAGGGIGILFMTDIAINAPAAPIASSAAPGSAAPMVAPTLPTTPPGPPAESANSATVTPNQVAAAAATAASAAAATLSPQTVNPLRTQ